MATVRRDFFLDPAKRLTEQERALMSGMLGALVGDVADSVRAKLPNGRVPANDAGDAALVRALTASNLLDETGLMRLLLQRADEERIATAAKARSGRREARTLQGLVGSDYAPVAAAAMALILGRGRRRGRFGESLLALDDLSFESAAHLVHVVAAGLRREMSGQGADRELAGASGQVLGSRDEKRGLSALTAALVHALEQSGSLTDELILAAANEGEVAFIAEILGRQAGVTAETALGELLSGEAPAIIFMLRMAAVSRELCARLLGAIGDLLGIADAGSAIAAFDSISDDQAEAAQARLLTAPAYLTALDRLGRDRG